MWIVIVKFGWAFRLSGYGIKPPKQSQVDEELAESSAKIEDGILMNIIKFG
jgi:hypothetical protein